MPTVDPKATRTASTVPSPSSSPGPVSQAPQAAPGTPAAPAAAPAKVPGSRDELVSSDGVLRASVDSISKKGARNQMIQGQITVNGHTYQYRSGGNGNGNLPSGDYTVTPHLWSRNTPGMVVGGVGYSFALSDKHDPRVGMNRTELRIHPDGGPTGTDGCIGIVGDASVQKRFREDMRAELKRNGGSFTLRVG